MTTTKNKHIQQAADQVLMIARVFDAPRNLVFKAWTEPESLKRWWSPKDFICTVSKVDLRPRGIGHMAVQLAKRMGASVLAVASGEDGVALARRLGADAAIDGHKDDIAAAAYKFAADGVNAALLTAGGKAAEKALAAIHDGGRVAYPNGVQNVPRIRSTLRAQSYDSMPDQQGIEKLNRLIKSGPFEVHIAWMFPLEKAADANRALHKHYLGKLALRPS